MCLCVLYIYLSLPLLPPLAQLGEPVVDEEEDVTNSGWVLVMMFAAVDAAASSHFVPVSAVMRNGRVSDRPVPRGEQRGLR